MEFLIKNCHLLGSTANCDLRLANGIIEEIGYGIHPHSEDEVIDAQGGVMLPGLHDHHIHLLSLAASLHSIACGPPNVEDGEDLARILSKENERNDVGWLRGSGYHHCVAGDIDRDWLDQHIPDRPTRIQHRGGRMWVVNSAGLDALGLLFCETSQVEPEGVERSGSRLTGRLYECDAWLRDKLGNQLPVLTDTSHLLAGYGITSVTDTSPGNGLKEWNHFHRSRENGQLLQDVRVMGSRELIGARPFPGLSVGEYKIHLLESQLPDMDTLCHDIFTAHASDRNIAIHCVSLTELVFALVCLEIVGVKPGDRIEHASITSPELLSKIREMGLRVITQPHFIYERGDQYLQDVPVDECQWLYRLRSFLDSKVALAAGSDAPFGNADPWRSMAAATTRETRTGKLIVAEEKLSPEQALVLYTSDPCLPGLQHRKVGPSLEANLCLLDRPWWKAREALSSEFVSCTWRRGKLIHRS